MSKVAKKVLQSFKLTDEYYYSNKEIIGMTLYMAEEEALFHGWDIESLEVEVDLNKIENGINTYYIKVIGNYA